jgi:uncharacterized membrane protein
VRFQATTDVSAPAQTVFDTYADVEHWPSWTSSVTSVEKIDPGPLKIGMRARVRQPRLPVTIWQVTELVPGQEFSWQARAKGVLTTGTHRVTPNADGTVRVTAILEQAGPLGPLVALLTWRLTKRYLRTEVDGLKAYCEA